MAEYIRVWDDQAGEWIWVPVTTGRDDSRPAPAPQPQQQPSGKPGYDDLGRPSYTGGEW